MAGITNDESETNDGAVRAELEAVLAADETVLGEVYRGLRAGLSPEQIRLASSVPATGTGYVYGYRRIINALLDGDLPTASTVAAQIAARFRSLLKRVDFSPQTAQVIRDRLDILETRAADPAAIEAEEKVGRDRTREAEAHAGPGIYVYTLPHYLRFPFDPQLGHTLLKVGHSSTSVIKRFRSQQRETVLPEDPVLLRIYPLPDAESATVEAEFHAMLDAADHARQRGTSAGREWFLTTTKFLDQIASILKLEITVVFDPEVEV